MSKRKLSYYRLKSQSNRVGEEEHRVSLTVVAGELSIARWFHGGFTDEKTRRTEVKSDRLWRFIVLPEWQAPIAGSE